jgi:hypothetical protein
MNTRTKVIIGAVAAVILLSGVAASGLYVALKRFSEPETIPPPKEVIKEPSAKPLPQIIERHPRPANTGQPNEAPSPRTIESYYATGEVQLPPFSTMPDSRRKAYHDAVRAMQRDGKEPDWSQFEGRDLEKLKYNWERIKGHQEHMERRRIRREQMLQQYRQNQNQ